jgi:hypothetical protein
MGDFPQLLHGISELLILSPHFPDPPLDSGWRLLPFFWRDRTVGWGHEIVGHAAYSTPFRCSFSTPLNGYSGLPAQAEHSPSAVESVCKRYPPELVAQVRELRKQGLSFAEIARRVGRSKSYIAWLANAELNEGTG